jgi:uncharacterized membrane protein YedE/YeeE
MKEVNIVLPLMFGLLIFSFVIFAAVVFWLLKRFNLIELTRDNNTLSVLKDALFSIIGVIIVSAIIGICLLIIEIIKHFFAA